MTVESKLSLIKDCGLQVAETPRLILKRFSFDDAEGFFELNSDPQVLQHTGDKPFEDINQVRRFIADYDQYRLHGFGRWSVYLKSSNEYIGFCGLRRVEAHGDVDIGFRLNRRFWHQGLAKESALASLSIGFGQYDLPCIIARAREDNFASHGLLKKLGMQFDAKLIEANESWTQYKLNQQDWLPA